MSSFRPFARTRRSAALLAAAAAVAAPIALLPAGTAGAITAATPLVPGDLLVSTSNYTVTPNITAGTTQLPPNCSTASGAAAPCATAVAGGSYPQVFNNSSVDGSFGVTEPITLLQLDPTTGALVNSRDVPYSTQPGATSDQLVTSFSSKSEIALDQSTDGSVVTFMGYVAQPGAIDVSNSNTPAAVDPTNTDSANSVYRAVAQLGIDGSYAFTETNAYSGNNGRAALLNSASGQYYLSGNAGNGANPEPQGVVQGVGAQLLSPAGQPESAQNPGAPTPVGNFNITQLGKAADKSAKDDNFRGLTVSGNTVYYTKGSGGNGVDTVYYVDTAGGSCPNGTGLPSASNTLPTTSTPQYSNSNAALGLTSSNPGLAPTNMCILKGFPTVLAKTPSNYPFGLYFASPTVLYVADEGSGATTNYNSTTNTYADAAASTTAGLEKWVLNTTTGTWSLAYTLQSGLNLGQTYTVSGYPTGTNTVGTGSKATTLPWAPATDGLRNLAGRTNADGSVTLYATTSTVSGSGDQGADPNELVSITDQPSATSAPSSEQFTTLVAPTNGRVVRGVSLTPGSVTSPPVTTPEVPWAPLLPLSVLGGAGALVWARTRRRDVERAV